MPPTSNRDFPSPEGPTPKPEETEKLRQRQEVDDAWEKSELERREVELQRRVKEHWRNPVS